MTTNAIKATLNGATVYTNPRSTLDRLLFCLLVYLFAPFYFVGVAGESQFSE
jgi:hypothetical protein